MMNLSAQNFLKVLVLIDLGFSEGVFRILGIGFAFSSDKDRRHGQDCLPSGIPSSSELLDKGTTTALIQVF